jgi:2-methylcitrate dehydratase PrpD
MGEYIASEPAIAGTDVPSLTRLAARRLRRISEDDLPVEVRERASLCLIDLLANIHRGLAGDLAANLHAYIGRDGGSAESTAFGCSGKVNAGSAAFVNGTLAHS